VSGAKKNLAVFFVTLFFTTLLSVGLLAITGVSDDNLRLVLSLTARIAFMIFLLVFVARPLRQLVRTDLTKRLLKERRAFGIAFAAVFTVHLGLIAYRFATVPGLEYPLASAIVGGTAYALTYAMLVTSFDGPARAIGPKAWRALHKTGLYYIGAVFLVTLLPEPGQPLVSVERLWFVVLTSAAIIIRLTAYFAMKTGALRPRG
jgi:DMSO/TMAO reductase YedYZ heme-binding membrane subunit